MRDFALALSGVLVGGLIALCGTVLQAKLTAEKEVRVELRGKLEVLLQNHYSDVGCNMRFVSDGQDSERCVEGRFGWKALALANIYFPEMTGPLDKYDQAAAKARAARQQCNLDFPREDTDLYRCIQDVFTKFSVSNQVGAVAGAVSAEAKKLRSD